MKSAGTVPTPRAPSAWRRARTTLCTLLAAWALAPAAHAADAWGIDVRDAPAGGAAEILAVAAGTPADLASLQAGDGVVQVQGKPVAGAAQYRQAIAAAASAEELTLVVVRGGWSKEVRLRAIAPSLAGFGLALVPRPGGPGGEIAAVTSGGPAAQAGLQPGDAITAAAGASVANVAALQQIFADHAARAQPLVVTVERASWSRQVTLAPRTLRDARPAAAAAPVPAPPPAVVATAPAPPSAPAPPAATVAAAPVATAPAPTVIVAPPPRPAAPPPPPPTLPEAPPMELPTPPGDVIADMGRGNRAYEAGNWREAEAYFLRVVQGVADEPNSWARVCHVQVMLQKFRAAAESCRAAARHAAREASVYQNLGYSLFRLGRAADSIAPYRKAIELAPDRAQAYAALGASYYALGDWQKTQETFAQAVARDPQQAAAWQALGDAEAELGRTADAIAAYRRALALRTGSDELYRSLGWQLYRSGDLPGADAAFREVNRLNPKDANSLVILGIVADRLGRTAAAREAWQRAAELEPGTPMGAMARQNLASLDARLATGRAAPIAEPSPPTRAATAAMPRSATAVEEPRAIAEPESDTGN